MPVDHIRYDILAQDALRGLVRRVLTDASKKGLPGDHHFFVTFDTRHDGVRLSPRLREQYPEEMTIVLQHQFWDLKISEEAFEVGLSFGGIPERLVVPFAALPIRIWMDSWSRTPFPCPEMVLPAKKLEFSPRHNYLPRPFCVSTGQIRSRRFLLTESDQTSTV